VKSEEYKNLLTLPGIIFSVLCNNFREDKEPMSKQYRPRIKRKRAKRRLKRKKKLLAKKLSK